MPAKLHPLARLLSGRRSDISALGNSIQYLAGTLSGLINQFSRLNLSISSNPQVSILGPYLARGILEVGFTLLLARLDPFRVLVLREVQQSPEYDLEARINSALQWKGDFLDDKVNDLWKASRKAKEMTRALLGDYHDHVFWRPSLTRLLDIAPGGRGGQWMADLRLTTIDSFAPKMRGRAERVYSKCSKGVHHEFVLPLSAYYDSREVREMQREVIEICGLLGLVLNTGGHVPFPLSTNKALESFEKIQQLV